MPKMDKDKVRGRLLSSGSRLDDMTKDQLIEKAKEALLSTGHAGATGMDYVRGLLDAAIEKKA